MSVAVSQRRPCSPPFIDPPGYARHRPEATLLYQLVEQHFPTFCDVRAAAGRPLPDYVQEEFDAYLKCGRLEEGFLRVRCEQCHAEKLVAFSCKKRGLCPSCGARRMAETAALLSRAALVLANDSAVMHLAFELGVPTVGVFGPTDHDKYGHGGANFRIAREDAAACSCDSASRPYGERDCFHGLGPDKVFQLCVELLQTERGGTGTA